MSHLKLSDGGFKKGMWQSARQAYSEKDIEALNNALHRRAKDVHSGWLKFLWEPRDPPQLHIRLQAPIQI